MYIKNITLALLLLSILTGCTLSNGIVKDVRKNATGELIITKCDIKYFSLYVMVADERNCREEVR